MSLTLAQLRAALPTGKRPNKYRNQPVTVDGHYFPSKREAGRYQELRLLEKAGKIRNLQIQVRFPLVVNEMPCGHYIADFVYAMDGRKIVEDVKSPPTRTALYELKKKLMLAIHNIRIAEV